MPKAKKKQAKRSTAAKPRPRRAHLDDHEATPDSLKTLNIEELRALCRRFNIELSGGGKRTTLCSCVKSTKNRKTRVTEHQGESLRQLNPGQGQEEGLNWLDENQRKELTDLIQASVQSATGEAVAKTTEHVMAVVRPDSNVTNEDHRETDPEQHADPPSAQKSTEPQS